MYPEYTEYDWALGIEPEIIDYIKESNVVESRIGSIRCYLFFQNSSGSSTGDIQNPITATQFLLYGSNYTTPVWIDGSGEYPDIRQYMNNFTVMINGLIAVRILDPVDLQNNNEYAIVERKDLSPATVEVWFNAGFDPTGQIIQYYFTTVEPGISDIRFKRGEGQDQSIFGWTQYLNPYYDPFVGINQILVRLPITPDVLSINEEGKVRLQTNDSWTLWEPYLHNYDIIVITPPYTFSGKNEVYEIVEKRDSVSQRVLTSQRFKLKLLEDTDPRYKLPIITS